MLNIAIPIGRLTRAPELRYSSSGQAVATFSLAVDRSFNNQQGEREGDFINVVCWRQLAETVANHLSKGALVTAVRGRVQVRSYETPEGQRRKTTEVVADTVRFPEPKAARRQRAGTATPGAGEDDPLGGGDAAPF